MLSLLLFKTISSISILSLTITQTHGAVPVSRAAAAAIVDLGSAKYQGFSFVDPVMNATNTNFLGIRYAAPPTGVHRFAAPRPPAAASGVQMADVEPNVCFALPVPMPTADDATPLADEDCLFLNVFVPGNLGEKKNLPVVFWIHGGGYVFGSAVGYSGNDLIREAGGNIVAVVVQYRLGLFGFLAGQKVKDGGALNAGLLDQQLALKFVQKHISKFGGDPTKVTIWGESAGAGSVLQHVVANGGRTNPQLFRAAITSSTYLPSQYRFNDRIPENIYSQVVSQTNCSSSSDTLACLRTADVDTLQAANVEINNRATFGSFLYGPVVDGTLITKRPTELLKQEKLNGDILYAVTNTLEGTILVNQTANIAIPQFVSQLYPDLTPREIAAATAQYAGLGSNAFQRSAIMGESVLICPTYYLLNAFEVRAFKGEFAIPPGFHGTDIVYYFPSQSANGLPPYANPQFDRAFAAAFLDFAVGLDPNVKWDKTNITPFFPIWAGSNEMLFNMTAAGAPDVRPIKTSSELLERCNFWNSVSAHTAQ